MEKEKETLESLQCHLAEGQLMDILRDKDQQILKLEFDIREQEKENELHEFDLTLSPRAYQYLMDQGGGGLLEL